MNIKYKKLLSWVIWKFTYKHRNLYGLTHSELFQEGVVAYWIASNKTNDAHFSALFARILWNRLSNLLRIQSKYYRNLLDVKIPERSYSKDYTHDLIVDEACNFLTKREVQILKYTLQGFDGTEIGNMLDISKQRVYQIRDCAEAKLKKYYK